MEGIRAIGATLLLCLAPALFAQPASAIEAKGKFMQIGVAAPRPLGHQDFCRREPDECRPIAGRGQPKPVELDQALIHAIARINVSVNSAIRAEPDDELYGVEEFWTYPGAAGDCEDFALEKRRLLHERLGIDYASLLLTVVRMARDTPSSPSTPPTGTSSSTISTGASSPGATRPMPS